MQIPDEFFGDRLSCRYTPLEEGVLQPLLALRGNGRTPLEKLGTVTLVFMGDRESVFATATDTHPRRGAASPTR